MSLLTLKRNYINILSLFIFVSMTFFSGLASAQIHYLQPGQGKTIRLDKKVHTVFMSKDSVANYEILGDSSLIIYGKKNGLTNLLAYDDENNLILDDTIMVDPILSQVVYRIKREFPNSDITIEKYATNETGDNSVYVIKGNVPDTTTKYRILEFIGAMVGTQKEKLEYSVLGTANKIDFLEKKTYQNIIDRIDVIQESQVNVKLTFVEVSKDFTDALGIEWQSLTLDSMVGGGTDMNSIGEFTLLGLKKGFDIGNITSIIRAIKSDRMAKVLAEPNLSVLSGETASFLVGGEIPVVKSGSNGDSSSIEFKEYGIKLNIGAKVHNNNRIRLIMTNEFSSVSGSYNFNNYSIPTLSTRKTSSTIDIGNGDSFVIAGLVSEQDEENLSRIPFLSDIPILGALGRSSSTNRSKTELVVFATVNLVTPDSSFSGVKLPVFERTDNVNLFLNIKNNMQKQKNDNFPITNESEKFINYMGFIE